MVLLLPHVHTNTYLISTKRMITKHLLISQVNLIQSIVRRAVRGGLQASIPSIRVFLLLIVISAPPTAMNAAAGTAASSAVEVSNGLRVVRPGLTPGPRRCGRGRGRGRGGGSSCGLLRLVAEKQAALRVLAPPHPLAGRHRGWIWWWRAVALLAGGAGEGKREGTFVRGGACGGRHGCGVVLGGGQGQERVRHERRKPRHDFQGVVLSVGGVWTPKTQRKACIAE